MHNSLNIIVRQTQDAYKWVNKLLEPIPYEDWDNMPPVAESTVSWQVGHLIMSFYYHSVMVIVGHRKEIFSQVPLKEYAPLYTHGSAKNAIDKVDPKVLHQQLKTMQHLSMDTIRSIDEAALVQALEPTNIPHPIANTKFEALDWNVKHTMWHCGQLGMLSRMVNQPYSFEMNVTT